MKANRLFRALTGAATGALVFAASPALSAPVITGVNADLSAAPFSFSFMGSTFTFNGAGGFPDYLSVSTTQNGAVRTVFGNPSTDFPNRGFIVYDQNTLGGYGSFANLTTIGASNGENLLGLRVNAGGQDYYGFAYTTNTTFNSYGFETRANTGIVPTTVVPPSAVPEPATWAMFIGGFGLIGGAMRRRQKVSVSFA
jgi:hypothetical protein